MERVRVDFTKNSAKITKTTIAEAVKKIQEIPSMYGLKMPAQEIINYIYNNLTVSRSDTEGDKIAWFRLRNPNPEFNKHSYHFWVKEKPSGKRIYSGYHNTLLDAVISFITYIPEFVEDRREHIDIFI